MAKFWLQPVRLQRSRGFARAELQRIQALVGRHEADLARSWDEYFKG